MKEIEGHDCKIFTNNIEQSALDQLNRLLSIPVFSNCKIRIMPDVHADAGCVIGFTADLGNKVIPNIVGVDIGCGMVTFKIPNKNRVEDFKKLDDIIRNEIPSGRDIRKGTEGLTGTDIDLYRTAKSYIKQLRCYRELKDASRLYQSIGTLGGGNHFIEIDQAENGDQYLAIHTGSRNLGKQVADIYQKLAVNNMSDWDKLMEEQNDLIQRYKAEGRKTEISAAIAELHRNFRGIGPGVPNQLRWLEGSYRDDYIHDMHLCQSWASLNRELIMYRILDSMDWDYGYHFHTIHNYIGQDNIIRKGAVSAMRGEKLLIPMNMRDGSLLCRGKGNPDWNWSAPHGAGRRMSRARAFQEIYLGDYIESMKDVHSWSVNEDTLDESPMAYKPMDEIIENIKPTVDIVEVIKPLYNFKAAE